MIPRTSFYCCSKQLFYDTFLAIAENSKLEFTNLSCSAEGILDKKDGKFAMTEIVLKPMLTIPNAADREKVETISADFFTFLKSPVALGIILGLTVGKFFGIILFTRLMVYLKICKLPATVQWKHIYGIGFIAGMGFTMSLFITERAFDNEVLMAQAKLGILTASLLAGIAGYFYLKKIGQTT